MLPVASCASCFQRRRANIVLTLNTNVTGSIDCCLWRLAAVVCGATASRLKVAGAAETSADLPCGTWRRSSDLCANDPLPLLFCEAASCLVLCASRWSVLAALG